MDAARVQPCPHCGSDDVIAGIKVSLQGEAGQVGLDYKGWLVFIGVEPVLADLCRTCGTVVRLYVEQTDKRWCTKKK
jgi:hypothetical protein